VARTRDEVLASDGSRYNLLGEPTRLCAATRPGRKDRWSGGAVSVSAGGVFFFLRSPCRQVARVLLDVGLLCSKTFDDAIFPELFEERLPPRPRTDH